MSTSTPGAAPARSGATDSTRAQLTPYEAEQVRRIAAWKSEPPNPLAELFRRVALPVARIVEEVIPDAVVHQAIERAYDTSEVLAGREDVKRRAGVQDLEELRSRPLEECDRLANQVRAGAVTITLAEGAATGAGGPITTIIDVPLLFVLSLRTILRIGHCYGYTLDRPKDRRYVLAILTIATSGSLDVRRERLVQLREIEDWLLEETQEEVLADEAASLLFQLEVFEEIPGVDVLSGALLNLSFTHKVNVTAQRVFQERWLREHGKVGHIEPAEAEARILAIGWMGALSRAAYSGCYYLGYGATLPAWWVASRFRPMDSALTRGVRDGAAAATREADHLLDWLRGAAQAASPAPAMAPAAT